MTELAASAHEVIHQLKEIDGTLMVILCVLVIQNCILAFKR